MATVSQPLPNAMFRVELENKAPGAGALSGRCQEFHPHSAGDRSLVGGGGSFRRYDRTARIVYRYKYCNCHFQVPADTKLLSE